MGEKIIVLSGDLRLEGLLEKGAGEKGVVITHPHPLYGGDMYNMIVASLERAYRGKGYSTLRLNFRGTGNSQGRFDDGIGEQADVLAALSALRDMGIDHLALAGYSFGAWVNALSAGRTNNGENVSNGENTGHDLRSKVDQMVMVSPPVGFIDFTSVGPLPSLHLVVSGSLDDIAPADMIRKLSPGWNPEASFVEIEGADHLYSGHMKQLDEILNARL